MATRTEGIDDSSSIDRTDLIRKYQQQMEEQAALDAKAAELRAGQPTGASPAAEEAARIEAQNSQTSGDARHDEAVRQASRQQDAAESWQRYADKSTTEVPPSVEDKARDVRDQVQKAEELQQEQQKISANELLNQLTLQSGRIRG